MTLKRKITAWTLLVFVSLPAFMAFNDNSETLFYNIIGIVYICLIYIHRKRLIPQWVKSYLGDVFKTS